MNLTEGEYKRRLEVAAHGGAGDYAFMKTLGSQEQHDWHEARKLVDPEHLNPYNSRDRQKAMTAQSPKPELDHATKDLLGCIDEYAAMPCGSTKARVVQAINRLSFKKERDAARQALEHDRSVVIDAVNQFTDAFARRSWLLESRGSYEWDDDRYRLEFKGAYDELAAPIEKLRQIGKDWSNCPTDHDEIMQARTNWQDRAKAAEANGIERAAQAVDKRLQEYISEHGFYDHTTGVTEYPGNGEEYVSELIEIAELIRSLEVKGGNQ